jgi:hypothetical protein
MPTVWNLSSIIESFCGGISKCLFHCCYSLMGLFQMGVGREILKEKSDLEIAVSEKRRKWGLWGWEYDGN